LWPRRKQLALSLMAQLHRRPTTRRTEHWRARLDAVTDPFSLRVPGRLCVLGNAALASPTRIRYTLSRVGRLIATAANTVRTVSTCYRDRGLRGVGRAVSRRLARLIRPVPVAPSARAQA